MTPPTALRTLATAAPAALAAVFAAATPAAAGTFQYQPHVLDGGSTLGGTFSTSIASNAANSEAARDLAHALGGLWYGGLVDYALRNTPPSTSTCTMTVTATDPSGAKGTATTTVADGAPDTELDIADQVPGTRWGVGNRDHFHVDLACADAGSGDQLHRVVIDQDLIAR